MQAFLGKTFSLRRGPLESLPALLGKPFPFLLLSATPDREKGRFSILGADPFLRFESRGDEVLVFRNGAPPQMFRGDPLRHLSDLMEPFSLEAPEGIPFAGGAVGFFAYSWKWQAMKRSFPSSRDVDPPDVWFALYDRAVVFDHEEGKVFPVATGFPLLHPGRRERKALKDLAEMEGWIPSSGPGFRQGRHVPIRFQAQIRPERYRRLIRAAQEFIAQGDVYQLNLSYRLHSPDRLEPYPAFVRLIGCNPAPFCAYLQAENRTILSTSPERFLRWDGRKAECRPIKGTRPRGGTPEEDRGLREELVHSDKERAENVMIVDLIRNDLGRVCRPGSVVVKKLAELETYSRVFHLVSTVQGSLRLTADRFDLIRALFPGGSMTGAPKIRSMELLDRLEPIPRGVYAGSLGYLSFSGEMDLSIVIRTVIQDHSGSHFHVGGAILADSDPQKEYEETLAKADAILQALSGSGGVRRIRHRKAQLRREGAPGLP